MCRSKRKTDAERNTQRPDAQEAPVGEQLLYEQKLTAPPVVRDGGTPQGGPADRSLPFEKGDSRPGVEPKEAALSGAAVADGRRRSGGVRTPGGVPLHRGPDPLGKGRAADGKPRVTTRSHSRFAEVARETEAPQGADVDRSPGPGETGYEDRGEGGWTVYGSATLARLRADVERRPRTAGTPPRRNGRIVRSRVGKDSFWSLGRLDDGGTAARAPQGVDARRSPDRREGAPDRRAEGNRVDFGTAIRSTASGPVAKGCRKASTPAGVLTSKERTTGWNRAPGHPCGGRMLDESRAEARTPQGVGAHRSPERRGGDTGPGAEEIRLIRFGGATRSRSVLKVEEGPSCPFPHIFPSQGNPTR